jgi:hypothetical protein
MLNKEYFNSFKEKNIEKFLLFIKKQTEEAGFEPTSTILKTVVLPLNYSPLKN